LIRSTAGGGGPAPSVSSGGSGAGPHLQPLQQSSIRISSGFCRGRRPPS
jgi:hypothetical protein